VKSLPLLDPTDILAIVLMAIFSMRRAEIRMTDARAFPNVPPPVFEAWKRRALGAKSVSINACFAKFALNSAWYFGFRTRVPPLVLVRGGLLVFFGWIVALLVAWLLSSRAAEEARRLGIVVGRKLVEAADAASAESTSESGASSR